MGQLVVRRRCRFEDGKRGLRSAARWVSLNQRKRPWSNHTVEFFKERNIYNLCNRPQCLHNLYEWIPKPNWKSSRLRDFATREKETSFKKWETDFQGSYVDRVHGEIAAVRYVEFSSKRSKWTISWQLAETRHGEKIGFSRSRSRSRLFLLEICTETIRRDDGRAFLYLRLCPPQVAFRLLVFDGVRTDERSAIFRRNPQWGAPPHLKHDPAKHFDVLFSCMPKVMPVDAGKRITAKTKTRKATGQSFFNLARSGDTWVTSPPTRNPS